jgi:hypothetical protein
MGLLLRAPLADTIVSQAVRKGTGYLDIASGRIGNTTRTNASKPKADRTGFVDGFVTGTETEIKDHGRFPSNFLLVHGPECECVGTKNVKPSNGSGKIGAKSGLTTNSMFMQGSGQEFEDARSKWLVNDDGTEEVDDWRCQPDCPVHLLDQQSGMLRARGRGNLTSSKSNPSSWFVTGGNYANEPDSGDEGGASRFFYQATTLDALNGYLTTLTQRGS